MFSQPNIKYARAGNVVMRFCIALLCALCDTLAAVDALQTIPGSCVLTTINCQGRYPSSQLRYPPH